MQIAWSSTSDQSAASVTAMFSQLVFLILVFLCAQKTSTPIDENNNLNSGLLVIEHPQV